MDRKYNGQTKKDKRTNNDVQNVGVYIQLEALKEYIYQCAIKNLHIHDQTPVIHQRANRVQLRSNFKNKRF